MRAAPRFVLLLLPVAAGCIAPRPATVPLGPAPAVELRPDVFFLGPTRGEGRLVVRGQHLAEVVRVESTGRMEPDGTFRLDQTIRREHSTARRTWRMRPGAGGTYTATLSDAHGPVTATVRGATLTLRYKMNRWGTRMDQTLTLLPGGVAVQNDATVSWMGVPMAYLSERITRLSGPMAAADAAAHTAPGG